MMHRQLNSAVYALPQPITDMVKYQQSFLGTRITG
jgi:hypothetical protein